MCSVGFAGKMINNIGKNVTFYEVTNPNDDPINPKSGTLRYGVTKVGTPVWITFRGDMKIKLQKPLIIGSYTTIDGRGSRVHISNGACFFIHEAKSVIIHGLIFHHCQPQTPGQVMGPGSKLMALGKVDGDAIRVSGSTKVWIDHNTLFKCQDGLIDVTLGSTEVTLSNNWLRDHNKVMLLGHAHDYAHDKNMKVTVAFNHFGPNCNQRMPRVRWGYAHVVNNLYQGWKQYAIGGSSNPSIKSEANYFIAPTHTNKEATSKINGEGKKWNFKSIGDFFENGAMFSQTGERVKPNYTADQAFKPADAKSVKSLTKSSGALRCIVGFKC